MTRVDNVIVLTTGAWRIVVPSHPLDKVSIHPFIASSFPPKVGHMMCSTIITATRALSTGKSEPISGRAARCVLTPHFRIRVLMMVWRTAGEARNAP